jgi:hypothetical protein
LTPEQEVQFVAAPEHLRADLLRAVRRRQVEQLADVVMFSAPPRTYHTARQLAAQPPIAQVIDGVLGIGRNNLSGPDQAGTSLLVATGCCTSRPGRGGGGTTWRKHDVAQWRNCTYVASEGLHDFEERWASQPLWESAADRIHIPDQVVNLLSPIDVDRFTKSGCRRGRASSRST